MTRAAQVRYLRTEPTMAYPAGRLIAVHGARTYVLDVGGWLRVGAVPPRNAAQLTRAQAEDWCAAEGRDPLVLDRLPADD